MRYARTAVSCNKAARSEAEYPLENRLKALYRTWWENDTLSGGKLLSNMHRSGPNCSMQYVMKGAIDVANSSEPMGVVRGCQSKPRRGMPMPPSLRWMLGQAATAAMPLRQVASTSSSRFPYGPTRFKPPRWFRTMVRFGTALAKAASSGNCGKHNP